MDKKPCTNFVTIWSVFTKLWSYKLLISVKVTLYPRRYKYFILGFFCRFLLRRTKPIQHSSNITKTPCWIKCRIGLTKLKNIRKKVKNNCFGRKFDREQSFHPTFSGSSNTIFMFDWFTPCFIQHFILITSLRKLELRISNDWAKLKRSAK